MVFDCDGLLLDTEKLWMRGEAALIERYGVGYTPEVREWLLGMGADELAPELERILDRPGEGAALVRELVSECWTEISHHAEPRPGAVDLVHALREKTRVSRSGSPRTRRADWWRRLWQPPGSPASSTPS